MGGGDLNLKKSWHPSTLKNIERVWRAEQKHDAEQKKIEQLQRELAEERTRQEMRQYAEDTGVLRKREEKLDWMYQGPTALVNREDYLTGRPIDKTFEMMQQIEENKPQTDENERIPESIFTAASGATTVDLVNKIREDPLFFIRKQEEENKKQLLNNPVKMKQLQILLRQSMGKKPKKSKKKSSKHSRRSSDSDKSSDRSRVSKKHKSSSKSDSSHKRKKNKDLIHHKYKNESDDYEEHSQTKLKVAVKEERKYKREHDDKRRKDYHLQRKNSISSSSEEEESQRKSRYVQNKRRATDQPEPRKAFSQSESKRPRKLTEEEIERKRQEMVSNAKWRDQQRVRNVTKYKCEEEKEQLDQIKGRNVGFIRPMLSKAAAKTTVESRIKSNIYNIQRSHSEMEKNFVRR